jgi:hypothetical protein
MSPAHQNRSIISDGAVSDGHWALGNCSVPYCRFGATSRRTVTGRCRVPQVTVRRRLSFRSRGDPEFNLAHELLGYCATRPDRPVCAWIITARSDGIERGVRFARGKKNAMALIELGALPFRPDTSAPWRELVVDVPQEEGSVAGAQRHSGAGLAASLERAEASALDGAAASSRLSQ